MGMKNINEKFTDKEYKELAKAKVRSGKTWHDFLLTLARKELKEEKNDGDRYKDH